MAILIPKFSLGIQHWIFGEAFSFAFFFGSEVIDRAVIGIFFSITHLKLAVLIEDLHGGLVLAS